jgi:hypothetical protein
MVNEDMGSHQPPQGSAQPFSEMFNIEQMIKKGSEDFIFGYGKSMCTKKGIIGDGMNLETKE